MSQEKLLPIGSVVLLKESNKRVMIVGRLQRQMGTEKVWDYSACFYPEGILDPQKMFLFNHDQIPGASGAAARRAETGIPLI